METIIALLISILCIIILSCIIAYLMLSNYMFKLVHDLNKIYNEAETSVDDELLKLNITDPFVKKYISVTTRLFYSNVIDHIINLK